MISACVNWKFNILYWIPPHKFRSRKLKQLNKLCFLWVYLAVLVGWVINYHILSSLLMNSYKRSSREQYVEAATATFTPVEMSQLLWLFYSNSWIKHFDLEIKNPLQIKYINIGIYLILSKGWKTEMHI